ncbi:MAG: FAD-binding protein [Candidatus Bathyarchaeota archaeon]|nr:MAG: FAD-binding protein [Candidatus Bathyarchaeota archaeon]
MRESIEAVARSRDRRLKETFPLIDLKEREKALNQFHPDYKTEGKRRVRLGPNKGDLAPTEVADLLEAHSLIDPREIDLSTIDLDVDILIIGGGGAGMVAALWANYTGAEPASILIVQKLRLGDANSVMSQGGIQAADRPNDNPAIHYLDTIGGGHFTNDPELVRALVMEAPSILRWHEELGVVYDREQDGSMTTLECGGTSRKRLHSCRDYTGLEIVRNLRDEVENRNIPVIEFTAAIELLMDEYGQVAGAVLYNMETQEYHIARSKSTILATGGFGRLHIQGYQTTNHYGATADGIAIAYRAGARLRDIDSVQYHPTGAAYPEQIVGLLVTEKVRSLGAQPVNKNGDLFVNPFEPRDVESAMIIRECYERKNSIETTTGMRGIWLDSPMIEAIQGEGTIRTALSAMWRLYNRFGIDMTKEPLLVFPTLHYQNGGIVINQRGETRVPGLFAAGEVTGGVHGRNRLMGNSVLDYNIFGRKAGIAAKEYAEKVKLGKLTLNHVAKYEELLTEAGIETLRRSPMLLPDYRGEKTVSHALTVL